VPGILPACRVQALPSGERAVREEKMRGENGKVSLQLGFNLHQLKTISRLFQEKVSSGDGL